MSTEMAQRNIDDLFPIELFWDIFSFLDLDAVRNVRLVSKKWKNLVIEANPELLFWVPLTDETIVTVNDLTETQISLHVYEFTGKENKQVSANEGAGLLFGLAEMILFHGDDIEPADIRKLMPYAVDTLRKLSFVNFGDDAIMRPLLDMTAAFSALRKLVISTSSCIWFDSDSYGSSTPFDCYTSIIRRLAALDSGPKMPSLESLILSYDFDPGGSYGRLVVLTEDMFVNFLAIAKLILKFRRTLKEVEIDFTGTSDGKRNLSSLMELFRPLRLKQAEQTEMQECIDAFHELTKLNLIRCRSVNVRDHSWDWELQLLRRPRNLKELHLISPRYDGLEYYDFPEMVSLLFPENRQLLTTVKIESHQPYEHPDVGVFGQCPNLKTLWLQFHAYWFPPTPIQLMHFTNVEKLSRQITNLHLKFDRKYDLRRQYAILSREQVRWIVENLKELKSFWAQLVLDTRATDNENSTGNANETVSQQANEEDDHEEDRNKEFVSSPSNIDVQLFRDITNMPKITDLKFDLMKTSNLAELIPVDEIREYTEMYKNVSSITTTCLTFPQIQYHRPVAYTEMTINIDRFLNS